MFAGEFLLVLVNIIAVRLPRHGGGALLEHLGWLLVPRKRARKKRAENTVKVGNFLRASRPARPSLTPKLGFRGLTWFLAKSGLGGTCHQDEVSIPAWPLRPSALSISHPAPLD